MLFALAILVAASPARADGAPVTPSAALALPIARRIAEDELRLLVRALPMAAQRRVSGVYVAFNRATPEVDVLAACDLRRRYRRGSRP